MLQFILIASFASAQKLTLLGCPVQEDLSEISAQAMLRQAW